MTEPDVLARHAVPDAVPEDTGALIDHILTRYHAVHRAQLPALIALAGRVEAAHAGHPGAPRGLAELLTRIGWEMESHMQKEEEGLFPTLRSGHAMPIAIELMRDEHDDHAVRLAELEKMMHGHVPPAGASAAWHALCDGTARLAADLREHIRLENDVLFPRFGG